MDDIISKKIDFDVIQLGKGYKQYDIIPRIGYGGENNNEISVNKTIPFDIPSSNFNSSFENDLNIEDNISCIKIQNKEKRWGREVNLSKLCYFIEPSLPSEFLYNDKDNSNNNFDHNKTSLLRNPGKREDFVFGNSKNIPFLPGGFEIQKTTNDNINKNINFDPNELNFDNIKLKTCPPGLTKGLEFNNKNEIKIINNSDNNISDNSDKSNDNISNLNNDNNSIITTDHLSKEEEELISQARFETNINSQSSSVIKFHQVFHDQFLSSSEEEYSEDEEEDNIDEFNKKEDNDINNKNDNNTDESIEDLLQQVNEWDSIYSKRLQKKQKKKLKWAVQLNMNMDNFYNDIPEMAIQYPFELDTFQKEAVYHLEKGESVFVAAHTSAGKTLVAEYAIALAKKHSTRAIYTSPIKALSNQKYRDFKETFGEVGLITGDVQINPESSCLIVTTEILRSMLYKGADLLRDVEWVIFDEVHYINDSSRGVVWEEVIIMLPERVNLILLSATVPNTIEFADWIGRTKKKPIYVMSTLTRPTPLEHHLCINDKIFKIVNKNGEFLPEGVKAAQLELDGKTKKSKNNKNPSNFRNKPSMGAEKAYFTKLIKMLEKKELTPVVIFVFSKKKCDSLAYGLMNCDLTSSSEKSEIHVFIENVISRLNVCDRKLPQVIQIKDLLKRGIGVHHSGLLPIIKEMVEILFGKGLCKVLFATETFAMGVNMPARTVVFHSLRKHDGSEFRNLLPGEYIQMSGRAGRRGIDSVGMVLISCVNQIPEKMDLLQILIGKVEKLESKFRLTYNMILNLIRVQDFRVQDMIKRSFSEIISQKDVPEKLELIKKGKSKLIDIEDISCIFGSETISDYYEIYAEIKLLIHELYPFIDNNKNAQKLISLGRLIQISTKDYRNSFGVILQKLKKISLKQINNTTGNNNNNTNTNNTFVSCYKVLVPSKNYNDNLSNLSSYNIIDVPITSIIRIFKEKMNIDSHSIGNDITMSKIIDNINRLYIKHNKTPLPYCTPKDFKISDMDFTENFRKKESLLKILEDNQCTTCPKLEEHYNITDKKQRLSNMIHSLEYSISDQNLLLLPEFESRLNVLKQLQYIDDSNAIQLKGRVARELNTVEDEIIGTEIVFRNLLTDLQPAEIVAVLSILVFQEKRASIPTLTETLQDSWNAINALAKNIGKIQADCGLAISPAEYARERLNKGLMEVVFEWAKGIPFADICLLTDVLEGSIVRCIVRLEEACREFKNVARIVGNIVLYNKLEEASLLIKRDIVFASSLYTH